MSELNFESAVKKIINDIKNNKEALELISSTPDDEDVVSMWHSSYGRFVRNSMGLWEESKLKKEMENMGFLHADDMSSALILCALRDMKDAPRKLSEQIESYKKYWESFR